MRPTLSHIAKMADVSLATVDRVMNKRPGVSARTRAHVMKAARQLGYLPELDDGSASPIRIEMLLPQGTNAYIAGLARQAQMLAEKDASIDLDIKRYRALDPAALSRALRQAGETSAAVAVVAINHPLVLEAIRVLAGKGVPIVTLASDIPQAPRQAFIGIDNGQAGRLAGYTLGRLLGANPSGKVALFAGSLGYRGHQEREMGFRQVLAEEFPDLDILELRESREDRKKAYSQTRALLRAHADIVGLYNAGGATVGIAAALEDTHRSTDVVFVAHEATEENKAYLLSGTLDAVIDQNARMQVREVFQTLAHAVAGQPYDPDPLQLQLIVRENLPPL